MVNGNGTPRRRRRRRVTVPQDMPLILKRRERQQVERMQKNLLDALIAATTD